MRHLLPNPSTLFPQTFFLMPPLSLSLPLSLVLVLPFPFPYPYPYSSAILPSPSPRCEPQLPEALVLIHQR
jgi:hypothetical protein